MVKRTGDERFPSTNYKTSNHLIAYMDILGAKHMICNDDNFAFLNHLNMFMKDAIEESGGGIFPRKEDIFVKIFSDNIVLAIELKENDEQRNNKITALFNTVANIYNEIFCYGYLMRGAIVEGEFFHNDNIVYGKGLVEAVKLEENEAIYPRILVQKELADVLPQYTLLNEGDQAILNVFLFSHGYDYVSFKLNLLNMLKRNKNNNRIKEKIIWTIEYFNSWFISPEARVIERPQIAEEDIAKSLI